MFSAIRRVRGAAARRVLVMSVLRRLAGPVFVLAGLLHFVRPAMYEAIMPEELPAHRELVYLSGVAEMAGGAALLAPDERTRRLGAWWLVATLVAIFPANVNMAIRAERYPQVPEPLLWARLPLQAAFIAWVLAAAKRP
jgi:uncharacterized membrane protein